jgi:outer membrane autotransporter protein
LHNDATGVVPDAVALNGAWNVRMRAEGVTVTDRTDPVPANWVVSEPATGVIADRDFSAEDFLEEMREQPGSPVFMEEYAPRAAVYEALPDFLLRLTGPGPNRKCRTAPEERVWVRFAGGQGSYEADRSTTGASYDLERFETEGGFSANFNERVKGWASVRHVWGSADAMSPTGGGAIDVRGLGSSVGGAWRSETGAYAMGCFSYMAYNVDMASRQAGLLRAGVDSRAYTLDFEAGLPFALTEQVQMTPRVWVVSSQVSVDSFTDTVEARVSFGDADRITGGLGFLADTTRPWGEGEFILRGSVDLERLLSGTETRVQVSGERLSAVATDSSLLVGLNGIYRQGRFSIGAEVAARQELGSNDSEYASFLNLGISF